MVTPAFMKSLDELEGLLREIAALEYGGNVIISPEEARAVREALEAADSWLAQHTEGLSEIPRR